MIEFFKDLYAEKHIIAQMTKRDFQSRYAGSVLGVIWIFLQPIAMMSILWFVFSFGLKAQAAEPGVSFVSWFFTAMIAWNFIADGWLNSTQALREYSFLVKKIKFNVIILPIVKAMSSLILHLVFIVILAIILLFNGVEPTWQWFSLLYYMVCSLIVMIGLGWISSALNVFSKDVGEVVNIAIQFGFWGTPIIWNYQNIPERFRDFLWLNPAMYITEGYRNALLYNRSVFAVDGLQIAYFWLFALFTVGFGFFIFKRLRPHFADVI